MICCHLLQDLHVDQGDHMALISTLSPTAFAQDTLIVAGDVADSLPPLIMALRLLKTRFKRWVAWGGGLAPGPLCWAHQP